MDGPGTRKPESSLGLAPFAVAKNKQARRAQSEKSKVNRRLKIQNLFVLSSQRDHHRPNALQHDSNNRNLRFAREISNAAEEESVLGHREVNARPGKHRLAEKPDRRNGDPQRNKTRSPIASHNLHHRARRNAGRGQRRHSQGSQANHVDRHVEHHHGHNPDHQRAPQIPARVANLAGDKVRRLPPSVGKQYRAPSPHPTQ